MLGNGVGLPVRGGADLRTGHDLHVAPGKAARLGVLPSI
jgi:hypothetical protein